MEWRGKTKYDSMVQTAYVTNYSDDDEWQVERVPYNIPGALVYYRNTKYGSTYALRPNQYDPPSYGPKYQLLVVDMNPRPLRVGKTTPYTSVLGNRTASYDAALTVQPSQAFSLSEIYATPSNLVGPFNFPSKPAVTSFHDSMGYYPGFYYGAPCAGGSVCYTHRDASAVIPASANYSVAITDYDGNPLSALYGISVVPPSPLGTGNPGDESVQHGLHIALTKSTGDTGTIKTWNALYDFDGSVRQTSTTGWSSQVHRGDLVDVQVEATNTGSPTDALVLAQLRPKVAYVDGSATNGAYPVTAGMAAALAKEYDLTAVAVPDGADASTVVGVAYDAVDLGTGEIVEFGFQVKVVAPEGTFMSTALVMREGKLLKVLDSNPLTIGPFILYLPIIQR